MDINKIINGLSKSGVLSDLAGGVVGGALGGVLVSGGGFKQVGAALKVGGLAAIGGLARHAWQKYQEGRRPSSGVAPELPDSSAARAEDNAMPDTNSVLLVRTMIAAAMADGHINAGETKRIFGQIDKLELRDEEKALVLGELQRPASMEELVIQVHDLHTATEVYASSLLAIDASCEKGVIWLKEFARQLELPAVLVDSLHRSVAQTAAPPGTVHVTAYS